MLTSVRGIYRKGKIKLYEPAPDVSEAEVIVTFLPGDERPIDLRSRGIRKAEAAELRRRLAPFDEDWNAPGMEAYDRLSTR